MMTSGFLVLDKPAGITSRDAVDHAQQWFPREKLGHAGTLDPAATGVLVLGVGPVATRLIEYVQDQEKVYETTIRLGGTSTTDDADGEITNTVDFERPTLAKLEATLKTFTGPIVQTPPAYSAAKIQGERAHTKARRGEVVVLQARNVSVYELILQEYRYPDVVATIRCSKGTYIRSIARDLGAALGCGGYVQTLRRTRIGSVTCEQAVDWNATVEQAHAALLPLSTAVTHLHKYEVSEDIARKLLCGQAQRETVLPSQVVSLWVGNLFLGIGEVDASMQRLQPNKMLMRSLPTASVAS